MATTQHLRIIDNAALESSMDSTQGLLSFMTNASRQIKTYLGPEQQQKAAQKKARHQQLLLQLSQLKTQNFNFIPDILQSSSTVSDFCPVTAPASPTPSLDSVGSADDDETSTFRSSCRRQKRSRGSSTSNKDTNNKRTRYQPNLFTNSNTMQFSTDYDLTATVFPNYETATTTCAFPMTTPTATSDMDTTYEIIIPSPSPDFDDLVDCMLTEDSLANIDVNNYFPAL